MVRMDHRGRFAKGCSNCRQRKIKCDEGRPSCNRCLKGQWKCPGYRELTDLTFRNQFMVTAAKARRQQARNIGESIVDTPSFQASGPSHSLVTKPLSPSKSLTLDLESVARAYFLSCHVIVGAKTLVRGQYEFLSDLLAGQPQVDPALYHCFNAAAFAAFGNAHNSVKLLQKSRVECDLAIQAVNIALQTPKTAAKDSTMVAAMLLTTFETVTYIYQRHVKECIDQLTGGLALLMIRGPKQLETRFGLQIFLQAYFLVVSACIHTEHALPPPLSKLRVYVQPYLDADNCSWRILDLMARFANLVDIVKDQPHQTIDSHLHLNDIATKLDDDFQAVVSRMPRNWRYQIFQCSDPVLVYDSIYHIYHDAWVIRYWNYLRLCRILLQNIILDTCRPDLKPSSLHYQNIFKNITQLSRDICATVPQHAGYLRLLQPQQTRLQTSSNESCSAQQEANPYTPGIYSLLYPLFAVGKMKSTAVQQRQWITSRLEYLGRISGISQALAAAEVMKSEYGVSF